MRLSRRDDVGHASRPKVSFRRFVTKSKQDPYVIKQKIEHLRLNEQVLNLQSMIDKHQQLLDGYFCCLRQDWTFQ